MGIRLLSFNPTYTTEVGQDARPTGIGLPIQTLSMMSSQPILSAPDSTGILPFEEVERQILAHALKVMDNNITKAAQALKIDRSTLYRKLKLYKLVVSN